MTTSTPAAMNPSGTPKSQQPIRTMMTPLQNSPRTSQPSPRVKLAEMFKPQPRSEPTTQLQPGSEPTTPRQTPPPLGIPTTPPVPIPGVSQGPLENPTAPASSRSLSSSTLDASHPLEAEISPPISLREAIALLSVFLGNDRQAQTLTLELITKLSDEVFCAALSSIKDDKEIILNGLERTATALTLRAQQPLRTDEQRLTTITAADPTSPASSPQFATRHTTAITNPQLAKAQTIKRSIEFKIGVFLFGDQEREIQPHFKAILSSKLGNTLIRPLLTEGVTANPELALKILLNTPEDTITDLDLFFRQNKLSPTQMAKLLKQQSLKLKFRLRLLEVYRNRYPWEAFMIFSDRTLSSSDGILLNVTDYNDQKKIIYRDVFNGDGTPNLTFMARLREALSTPGGNPQPIMRAAYWINTPPNEISKTTVEIYKLLISTTQNSPGNQPKSKEEIRRDITLALWYPRTPEIQALREEVFKPTHSVWQPPAEGISWAVDLLKTYPNLILHLHKDVALTKLWNVIFKLIRQSRPEAPLILPPGMLENILFVQPAAGAVSAAPLQFRMNQEQVEALVTALARSEGAATLTAAQLELIGKALAHDPGFSFQNLLSNPQSITASTIWEHKMISELFPLEKIYTIINNEPRPALGESVSDACSNLISLVVRETGFSLSTALRALNPPSGVIIEQYLRALCATNPSKLEAEINSFLTEAQTNPALHPFVLTLRQHVLQNISSYPISTQDRLLFSNDARSFINSPAGKSYLKSRLENVATGCGQAFLNKIFTDPATPNEAIETRVTLRDLLLSDDFNWNGKTEQMKNWFLNASNNNLIDKNLLFWKLPAATMQEIFKHSPTLSENFIRQVLFNPSPPSIFLAMLWNTRTDQSQRKVVLKFLVSSSRLTNFLFLQIDNENNSSQPDQRKQLFSDLLDLECLDYPQYCEVKELIDNLQSTLTQDVTKEPLIQAKLNNFADQGKKLASKFTSTLAGYLSLTPEVQNAARHSPDPTTKQAVSACHEFINPINGQPSISRIISLVDRSWTRDTISTLRTKQRLAKKLSQLPSVSADARQELEPYTRGSGWLIFGRLVVCACMVITIVPAIIGAIRDWPKGAFRFGKTSALETEHTIPTIGEAYKSSTFVLTNRSLHNVPPGRMPHGGQDVAPQSAAGLGLDEETHSAAPIGHNPVDEEEQPALPPGSIPFPPSINS